MVTGSTPGEAMANGANPTSPQTDKRRFVWRMAERSPLSRWDEKGTWLGLASLLLAEQGYGRTKAVL
jgi:hypothetical protein